MGILRFILALSVVIAHSSSMFGLSFVGGQVAVQSFYIISGFYMSLILNEKYIGNNNSYKLFITNRFLKIYPIYWTILLLTVLSSIILFFYSQGTDFGRFAIYVKNINNIDYRSLFFLIFSNIFILFQDIVLFLGLDTSTGLLFFTSNFRQTSPQLHLFLFIPQAWTLGIEMSFYLIAPFIVKKRVEVIILIVLLSLFLRLALSNYGMKSDPWSYRFFPTELVFFLLGNISYKIYIKLSDLAIQTQYLIPIWVSILLFTLSYSLIPISYKYEMYLFAFFICLPFVFLLTKKWSCDRYIGELSYPIYITHVFVLACIKILKIPLVFGLGLSLTIASVMFSILLNELIAKKIEKMRQSRIIATAYKD